MYNSSYFKLSARERLRNNYAAAVLGAIIYMIPTYLMSQIILMFNYNNPAGMALGELVSLLIKFMVINIFEVGLLRFLMSIAPSENGGIKKHNFNLLLSGYTVNFGNTLKVTFMVTLKKFLWALLALVPTAAAGIYVAVFVPPNVLVQISSSAYAAASNSSPEAAVRLAELISSSFPHLPLFSFLYLAATVCAAAPLIYKSFEYSMIPFIMADNPEMTSKRAFRRTYDIMEGFRMRLFLIQLSFILYYVLVYIVFTVTGLIFIYFIALAMFLPYQYMTYIEFYRQRNEVIEHNISTYGEDLSI